MESLGLLKIVKHHSESLRAGTPSSCEKSGITVVSIAWLESVQASAWLCLCSTLCFYF